MTYWALSQNIQRPIDALPFINLAGIIVALPKKREFKPLRKIERDRAFEDL